MVVPEGSKWCPRCGEVKLLEEYPQNRSETSGYMSYCKPCFNDAARESRELRHGSARNYHLKHRYGITEADFDRMLAEQNSVCAICKEALGQFRDRTDLMLQAVAYLRGGDWQSARGLPGVTVCFALVNEDPDSAPPADAA